MISHLDSMNLEYRFERALEIAQCKAMAREAIDRIPVERNEFRIDLCAKGILALFVTLQRQGLLDEAVFTEVIEELYQLDLDENGKVDIDDLVLLLMEEERYRETMRKINRDGRRKAKRVRRPKR